MSFPSNYPNSPPTVRFTSEIWHPNGFQSLPFLGHHFFSGFVGNSDDFLRMQFTLMEKFVFQFFTHLVMTPNGKVFASVRSAFLAFALARVCPWNMFIFVSSRGRKKTLTTVQGLRKEFSYEKILKDLKTDFCCNGNVVQDKELGKVIQLHGDQRKNVSQFLINADLSRRIRS